jgi:hypothetical protein
MLTIRLCAQKDTWYLLQYTILRLGWLLPIPTCDKMTQNSTYAMYQYQISGCDLVIKSCKKEVMGQIWVKVTWYYSVFLLQIPMYLSLSQKQIKSYCLNSQSLVERL